MRTIQIDFNTLIVTDKVTCVELREKRITIHYTGGQLNTYYKDETDATAEYEKLRHYLEDS